MKLLVMVPSSDLITCMELSFTSSGWQEPTAKLVDVNCCFIDGSSM